jgi:hypothetical protein
MTTVKEFADLLKAELKNLYYALGQQKTALEGNPSIESNTWLLGAAYSLDHQVTDFLTKACDAVEDDPPAPDEGVPDPPTEPTPLTLSYQMYDPANGKKYKILLQEIV